MKNVNIVNFTTNRSEFNRAYKRNLEHIGKIRCSYCSYHKNENKTSKWYGGIGYDETNIRFPNWKLVSKNRKQWMKKPIKIKKCAGRNRTYVDVIW